MLDSRRIAEQNENRSRIKTIKRLANEKLKTTLFENQMVNEMLG